MKKLVLPLAALLASTTQLFGQSSFTSIQAFADATISPTQPGTNFGLATSLPLEYGPSFSGRLHLVRFSLAGIQPWSITSAAVNFTYANQVVFLGGSVPSTFFTSSGAWQEATVTWETRPQITAGGSYNVSLSASGISFGAGADGDLLALYLNGQLAAGAPYADLVFANLDTQSQIGLEVPVNSVQSAVGGATLVIGQIPEPSTYVLFGLGGLGIFAIRYRRQATV